MSLEDIRDSDLIDSVGAEEFEKSWVDAVENPASSDNCLSDIAKKEISVMSKAILNSSFTLTDWPGAYLFELKLSEADAGHKTDSQFSKQLKKLYVRQNRFVNIHLLYSVPPSYSGPLAVSACLMFSSPDHVGEHVKVCYQHSHKSDGSLKDQLSPYLLRMTSDSLDVKYLQYPNGRHVVQIDRLPVEQKTNYQMIKVGLKFTDLSSCVGGINRRATCLVLCLVDQTGLTVGRRVLPVRICTSPRRDCLRDEGEARGLKCPDKEEEQGKYWVLATSKERFELLTKYGELLEQNGGGDTAKWNEEVKIFNKELSACKRRKVQKSDDF